MVTALFRVLNFKFSFRWTQTPTCIDNHSFKTILSLGKDSIRTLPGHINLQHKRNAVVGVAKYSSTYEALFQGFKCCLTFI